ncbi:MAG TPA: cation:dicarboxylase symporter family transporter, partial [Tissierellaceae bacterium]
MSENKKQSVWSYYKFPIILLCSIIIGSLLGVILGKKAEVLKPFGDIFLNAMFTIVVPLVFITISSAVASIVSLQRLGKILTYMIIVFVATGIIASVIMIITVSAFPPALGVKIELPQAEELKPLNTAEQIVSAITVPDFPDLISRKNMMPLIIFSVLFGFAISMLGEKAKLLVDILNVLSDVMLKLVSIIMYYAPIGLGAYFASLVGTFGPQ